MKTRAEFAAFVNRQISRTMLPENKPVVPMKPCERAFDRPSTVHYGVCELRELADYLYEGSNPLPDELIETSNTQWRREREQG